LDGLRWSQKGLSRLFQELSCLVVEVVKCILLAQPEKNLI
jgi:hypothetical protein